MIIRHEHMRRLRYCNKGARAWFEKHGLDWSKFVTDGIPEEELIATGDAMAIRVVEESREWEAAARR